VNVALDTNAYSEYARGDARRLQVIQAASLVYVPLFTLAELKVGFLGGRQFRRNEAQLQRFLQSPRVRLLLPDEGTATHFAYLDHQLRSQGTPIPVNDLWIAALVVQHGLILCTSDSHFDHLPQIPRC
jgi:tRNA(fMet)-specific endonuclease VapC